MKGHEGWLAVTPGTSGWGSQDMKKGYYLFLDSETMNPNQEFTERPDKIVYGRVEKASSRTVGALKPGGDITFQPRSNDCLSILMSHFQKKIGTTEGASGTAKYTFVPAKGRVDWVGSTWGSGVYGTQPVDLYTVNLIKCFCDPIAAGTQNAMFFKSCFAEKLVINTENTGDMKITASMRAYDYYGTSITLAPPNATYGTYSDFTSFEYFEGTIVAGGMSDLRVKSCALTFDNKCDEEAVIGRKSPSKYDFGKYECTGVVQIDAPDDVLQHMGSMLNNRASSFSGTWYNSAISQMTISMPNIRFQDFKQNLAAGNAVAEYGLPFKAYESEDGATSPVTVTVISSGIDDDFNVQ